MEPLLLGTATGTAQLFTSFFSYFKSSRSPYLLAGVLCVICLISVSGFVKPNEFFLIFVPLGLVFSLLSLLSFFYAPHQVVSANVGDIGQDVDEEFKFSRTVCLCAGILSFTYLFYKLFGQPILSISYLTLKTTITSGTEGLFFWLCYGACLAHLIVFVAYLICKNIREETVVNVPLFQISLFTAAALLGLVFSGGNIPDQDTLINRCQTKLTWSISGKVIFDNEQVFLDCDNKRIATLLDQSEKRISQQYANSTVQFTVLTDGYWSPRKILFWFFLTHFALLEFFWVRRLRRIVRLTFSVRVLD